MNLHRSSASARPQGKPLRVGLIGAGKFGSMYLAQVPRTPGVHLVGDRRPLAATRGRNLERVGWTAERARGDDRSTTALARGPRTSATTGEALVAHPAIDIVVEATGNPIAARRRTRSRASSTASTS